MDWMEQEQERGITITSAATTCHWTLEENCKPKPGAYYGGAFSSYKYDLLKEAGWDGYIISDWVPVSGGNGSWGWKDYTTPERAERLIELGMNQMGGFNGVDEMVEGWELLVEDHGEEEDLELMRTCAYKNVIASMRLGLFDNPYCSTEKVMETNCTAESLAYGIETQEKAMVLLKNDGTKLHCRWGDGGEPAGWDGASAAA